MAITRKTWYAMSRETTPGTAATTASFWLPKKGDLKRERKPEYSTEERGTRDTNYQVQYTTRKSTADFKGLFYVDTDPYFILGAMGAVSSTQPDSTHVPTVYKHTFSFSDTLPSYTIFKNYDSQVYQQTMNYVEKFDIKVTADGKLIEFESTLQGQYPTKYTGSTLTPNFSWVKPLAGYAPTLQVGGVSTNDISEFTFSFQQKLAPWYAISGSPDMLAQYPGERTASIDFTARFDATTWMDNFDNTSDVAITFDLLGALLGSYSGTNYYQELNMTYPVVNLESVETDLSKDNVLVKCKAKCRPGSGTALFTCFAQNTVTSYAS
jgi:hypothetical protein